MSKQELIKEIESIFPLVKRMAEYEQRLIGAKNQIDEVEANIRKKKSLRTL